MSFYYLLTLGVLLLIWGILYVIRALKNSEETNVTPIADIKEITRLKESYLPLPQAVPVSDSDPMTNQILKENLIDKNIPRISVELANGLAQDIKSLQEKVGNLSKENARLKDALEQETAVKINSSPQPSLELNDLNKEIASLKEVNQKLISENLKIQNSATEDKDNLAESQKMIDLLKKELKTLNLEDQFRIKTLEDQLNEVNQEQDKVSTNKLVLDKLSAENQDLLFEVREKEVAHKRLLEEKNKLVADYEHKLNQLEQRIGYMQNKMMKEDQQILLAKLQETHENLRVVALENERLRQLDLQRETQTKDLQLKHQLVMEREKFLQYELTKSRAQLIGLERLCEDFKQQIEAIPS